MLNRRSLAGAALLIAVFAVPAWHSGKSLLDNASGAVHFAGEPREARRAAIWGSWYSGTRELRRTPGTTTVDIVMATPDSRDVAIFAGTSLAPRACSYFDSWESWRRRQPAVFFHDADAANAVLPPPPRAAVVLIADVRRDPPLREATAVELKP